jgi:hypothetical protein
VDKKDEQEKREDLDIKKRSPYVQRKNLAANSKTCWYLARLENRSKKIITGIDSLSPESETWRVMQTCS